MKQTVCPSCGAPVIFRAGISVLAVCGFCRSTLLRQGAALENLGKMGELMEDASPIQLGTEGRLEGKGFTVVGRIQLRHEQGLWNEWHVLFGDGRSGWLSESSGAHVISFPARLPANVPAFDQLAVEATLPIEGDTFQVMNKETATCVAGEGELPFKVGSGYPAPLVDLASETRFATLDYSDGAPLLFVGRPVELPQLKLTHLRDREATAAKVKSRAFACTGCGAPLELRTEGALAVACGSCGAVVDAKDPNHAVLSQFAQATRVDTLLPLGSRGRLRGDDYDVVGYLRRKVTVDGIDYEWEEYLLHGERPGFRWLSQYQGHWSLAKPLAVSIPVKPGGKQPQARYLGKTFRHFQRARATVTLAYGEFYWQVEAGEWAQVDDYVAPPLMLTREKNPKEQVWALGEYLEPEAVSAGFKLKKPLPVPQGVAPNQPSPFEGRVWRAWAVFALALVLSLVLQSVLGGTRSRGGDLLNQFYSVAPDQSSAEFETQPFRVDKGPTRLGVRNWTNVNNSWAHIALTLRNVETGEEWQAEREVGAWSGVEDGDHWSEGSSADEAVLAAVPAGQYVLQVELERDPEHRGPLTTRLTVVRSVPGWGNWVLAALLMLAWPAWLSFRRGSFETRRWAESDYAPEEKDE